MVCTTMCITYHTVEARWLWKTMQRCCWCKSRSKSSRIWECPKACTLPRSHPPYCVHMYPVKRNTKLIWNNRSVQHIPILAATHAPSVQLHTNLQHFQHASNVPQTRIIPRQPQPLVRIGRSSTSSVVHDRTFFLITRLTRVVSLAPIWSRSCQVASYSRPSHSK